MHNQLRKPAAGALKPVVVVLAVVLAASMATGWLYWIRAGVASWPGPTVADALPLDELSGHDAVPLIVYVAAFAAVGALAGLAARAAKLSRSTAGLSLAGGTWLWLLAVDAFSLYVVRQVPPGTAVRTAAGLPALYLAAGLVGGAGALLGRGRRPGARAHRLLAWLAVVGGSVNLIAALVPHSTLTAGLGSLAPHTASRAAQVLLVPAGLLLVITSRGLLRRNRRAWMVALIVAASSVLLLLLAGSGYPATVLACLITIALAAGRDAFPFRGDPEARPSAWRRLIGMVLAALLYGVAAFWAYRSAAGQPFRLGAALLDTVRAMTGQLPRDIDFLPGEFADWYPLSILSILTTGVVWALAAWLRPWRQRLIPDAQQRSEAIRIVRQWGADTLAPFALRADKDWFVTGQTLIAYRVVRGVALVSGDPIGPSGADGAALDSFLSFARRRGWRTAILGASDRLAATYRSRGLLPVYHGDEAVIDTSAFCLDGRQMRAVRQAVHRLERGSYRAEVIPAGGALPALRDELSAVEHAWLRGKSRTGFSMELDSLFRLGGHDAAFVIGRDAQGRVGGFLHLAVCQPGKSLSLSTMPRLPGLPNGFTSWLVVAAVSWARDHGYERLSLNFSPFATLLTDNGQLAAVQRLQRRALLRVKRLLALQLDNLLRFNEQFAPLREPRYIVVETVADLPRVALAAMAAEGYLPFAALVRGRGWSVTDTAQPALLIASSGRPPVRPSTAQPIADHVPAAASSLQRR
jgi:lysyl-tRNA synthetase, class II